MNSVIGKGVYPNDLTNMIDLTRVRIILDRFGKIPSDFTVKNKAQKTIIFTEQEIFSKDENCIYENIIFVKIVS